MRIVYLLLCLVLLFVGCKNSVEDVETYFAEKDYEEICYIIEEECNLEKGERNEDVIKLGITLLIDNKIEMGITFLEDLYWDGKLNSNHKEFILEVFNKNEIPFRKIKKVFETYSSTQAVEMILKTNDIALYKDYIKGFVDKFGEYPDDTFIERLNEINPDNMEIQAWTGEVYARKNKLQTKNKIISLKDKIEKLEQKLVELNHEAEEERKFWYSVVTIYGYIIEQIKSPQRYEDEFFPNGYEIVLDYADEHSLLYTRQTVYSSRGRFALKVIKLADFTAVRVEGGFTQNWDTYFEVGEDRYAERERIMNGLKTTKNDLNDYRLELTELEEVYSKL